MRRIVSALLMIGCLLSGCGVTSQTADPMEAWLEAAALDAEETAEALYVKALEEDVLTIYTVSSRVMDVAQSFQTQYPGLQVEVIYTRAEELVGQVTAEAEDGKYKCDLLFVTNGDGSLTENLIPKGLAYSYLPWDIKDKMRTSGNAQYVSVLLEVPLLAYNSCQHAQPPVSNWWELTEPQWQGKVYITNPTRSMISYTLFAMMQQHEAQMEEAYLAHYGAKFQSTNGEGAFHTFLRKLVENDMHVVNDSDDVADAIGKPGIETPGIGILNASKIRLNENGYSLAMSYELSPFPGVINPANIMIAGGAKNISAAKLFVRWMLGETDGRSPGYQPFVQEGAWPARTDVDTPSRPLASFGAIYTDEQFAYENRADFLTFWESLMESANG